MLGVFLTSCGKDDSTGVSKAGLQKVPTQIGSNFDRSIDRDDARFNRSIFSIKSEMSGTQGIAIYLGEFNNQKLFLSNKHIINQDFDDCDSMLSLVDVHNTVFLGCSSFIHSFKSLDLSIITMDFVLDEPETTFDFQAVEFAFEPFVAHENLVLRTIDSNLQALAADQSIDCSNLDIEAKFIEDPHPESEFETISTWSLPVGCDAQGGDSGAPLYQRDSDKILGILWGGKFNKKYVSSETLKQQIHQKSPKLWTDYNFFIPAVHLKSELKSELLNLDPNSLEFETLSALYSSF